MSKQALQNWLDFFAGNLTTFVDNTMEVLGIQMFTFTSLSDTNRVDATFYKLKEVIIRNAFYQCFFKTISFPALTKIAGTQQFQNSPSLTEIDCPNLETITDANGFFWNCTSLQTVNLGKITSIGNPSAGMFNLCSSLTDVYMENMQSSTILSYPLLTTKTGNPSTPHQVVFHCADGDVVWSDNENAWVKQTS